MYGKRILLGITGGIAAYKVAFLIRLLKKSGAEVKCIMTPASKDFISPLVVSTLSGNPVAIEFWNKADGTWNNHVDYGLWADLLVIAPVTANTLSKMVSGACDNLLLATYLSMKGKTMIAPAMDLDMYAHPATKRNLSILQSDGVLLIPAGTGELASGLEGEGRMAEPEEIFAAIQEQCEREVLTSLLSGKKVLITAGPTHEALDPVRFIGNHSSGKMGYALAEQFLREGAEVILVSGPVTLKLEHPKLTLYRVKSAREMAAVVEEQWPTCQIGVFAAAVADYRPKQVQDQKIKKEKEDNLTLELVKNPDILGWAGQHKNADQLLVGFALETQDVEVNAAKKLATKNLDLIVMNTLEDEGVGFGLDTNRVRILDKRNKFETFELKSKTAVAQDIINYLKTLIA
ncbi:MAG: phosphopantothenoylcysteine decarboxylase [Bacteroidetes bacterium RIFCSPHIGHO2_02_FULL_44_7]|nr:MAG: phosphopantothenoylcysteine decarboxylase [Bacteroidetes bacterium RIFCSPHIGHO2_02_FULL_44_7]